MVTQVQGDQVTYFFYIPKKFIGFPEFIWISFNFPLRC